MAVRAGGEWDQGEMGTMTEGKRRMEEGEERAKGRGQKGRLIQERDRWGLAWVGMNRVVRVPVKTSLTVACRVRSVLRRLRSCFCLGCGLCVGGAGV